MATILNTDVIEMARRSVLCWLATSDENGQPNLSPKEVFSFVAGDHIVVANIASPGSARNIQINAKVCLNFVDVFAQKGFKVYGVARDVKTSDTEFSRWVEPLRSMVGDRFDIQSVFVVSAVAVEPIIAPSYRFYPHETTEESQILSALRSYGVRREQ